MCLPTLNVNACSSIHFYPTNFFPVSFNSNVHGINGGIIFLPCLGRGILWWNLDEITETEINVRSVRIATRHVRPRCPWKSPPPPRKLFPRILQSYRLLPWLWRQSWGSDGEGHTLKYTRRITRVRCRVHECKISPWTQSLQKHSDGHSGTSIINRWSFGPFHVQVEWQKKKKKQRRNRINAASSHMF